MSAQCRLYGKLPNVASVEGVAHIVISRSVSSAQIVGILRSLCKGLSEPVRERDDPAVGYLVKRMTVSVINLEQALAPATEAMLERKHHPMVVGNAFCIPFRHCAESGVGRAVRNRVTASPSW